MNRAQTTTWLRLPVSVMTLWVAATLIMYFRRTGIDIYDVGTPERIGRHVLLATVALIQYDGRIGGDGS
jgi:hypothetical protein